MKKLTKEIRNDVKLLIENVGGTANILNQHKNEIKEKYITIYGCEKYSDKWFEILETIDNQINYFHFSKGL
jgi:hypothetical protein